jgi:hypothetical protein
MTKVFITKYALTQGILERECEITKNFARWGAGHWQRAYNGKRGHKEWFLTLEEAREHAENIRKREINYSMNRIKKLSQIRF